MFKKNDLVRVLEKQDGEFTFKLWKDDLHVVDHVNRFGTVFLIGKRGSYSPRCFELAKEEERGVSIHGLAGKIVTRVRPADNGDRSYSHGDKLEILAVNEDTRQIEYRYVERPWMADKVHTKCFKKIPTTVSERDPNQGWGDPDENDEDLMGNVDPDHKYD